MNGLSFRCFFDIVGQNPVGDEILINIIGLKLKPILKRNGLFVFTYYTLRLTPYGKKGEGG